MHDHRFLLWPDIETGPYDIGKELLRLGASGRGFCVAKTWCADKGFVVWCQNEGGEGIPFFHEELLGALRAARMWVETGEGWGWEDA